MRQILMILLFFIAACDSNLNDTPYPYSSEGVPEGACTADAMVCPDGSIVGRDAENNCEFGQCAVGSMSQEEGKEIAENFIRDSATFRHDGFDLGLVDAIPLDCAGCFQYVFTFHSRSAGYGDRQGTITAQVVTPHIAVISIDNMHIGSAIIDAKWDMLKETFI